MPSCSGQQVIFSNAGYIKTGFFADSDVEGQLANYHCNATASVHLAHHYISRMRASGKRGCVVFTSSPAALMPCPFSAMYVSFQTGFPWFQKIYCPASVATTERKLLHFLRNRRYGATKAFLTEFAVSIAPELKNEGIDISVVHPSPVDSMFYQKVLLCCQM